MLRRLKKFEYLEPTTVEQAVSLLKEFGREAKILAGGTDLLVNMKKGKCAPSYLIDVKRIHGLDTIVKDGEGGLLIGALTTIRTIELSGLIAKEFSILSQAAHSLGSKQIRNRATIGGNLCNASPAADMAPALIGLKATVDLVGRDGLRSLPLEDFFRGPGLAVMEEGEILTGIRFRKPTKNSCGVYLKHTIRRSVELAVVGVGVVLEMNRDDHTCTDGRVVLGAVAPRPIRAKRSETLIKGNRLEEKLIKEIGQVASQEASPITDVRASAEYRKEMISVFVRRALHVLQDGLNGRKA